MTKKPRRKGSQVPEDAGTREPGGPPLPEPGAWPENIPILGSQHIVRHVPHASDGVAHDLGGWLDTVFDCSHPGGAVGNPLFGQAFAMLMIVLREQGVDPALALWEVCENETYKCSFLARCWNETMFRLGYTVPEEVR